MKERKIAILSAIITEHVSTGNTVASKLIVDKHDFSVSPATIRNEMAVLEKEGFIYQPHTSAGRIPTEKGWKFYIEDHLQDIELSEKQHKELVDILKTKDITYEGAVKGVAKQLAEMSKQAVFVGFDSDNFYYTGLSNLFQQPEFQSLDLVCHVSGVVDHMDDVIQKMFDTIADEVHVMVGSENPFGTECSSIVSKYSFGKNNKGLFGILGPMRMNYETNLALMKHTKKLFANA